jgi:hypothetical protein
MSAWLPVGSVVEAGSANGPGGMAATAMSGGAVSSIAAAQQAQVHRTQNAGQPLSGADSLVPIGHVSGTRSELRPLASAMSKASTTTNKTRRIRLNITSWLSRP